MENDDFLKSQFEELLRNPKPEIYQTGNGAIDIRGTRILAMLGVSIRDLDRTSGNLAKVNIFLGMVLAAIGIIQIILMVKGH